jgi:ABC-2 type transport system ATP-binding protein
VVALKSLDLKVPKDSIYGILGPSGAGKTTIIKLLLGLTTPTGGSGTVFGRDIVRDSLEIRSRVGYLAQEPLYRENITADETLRFTLRFFHGGSVEDIESRVGETLELVGLADMADWPVEGLSAGERQRLGIAQAQVYNPDLLILDEPAANLEPMRRRDVLRVIERLRGRTTILYSTHVLDDLLRVSDTVGILNRGELVAQAPIGELLAGGKRTVYSVVFKGDPGQAHPLVAAQPWVSTISEMRLNGRTAWHVTVTDEAIAEAELLRLVLADEGVTVTEFGRKKPELESLNVSVAKGGQRDGSAQ